MRRFMNFVNIVSIITNISTMKVDSINQAKPCLETRKLKDYVAHFLLKPIRILQSKTVNAG